MWYLDFVDGKYPYDDLVACCQEVYDKCNCSKKNAVEMIKEITNMIIARFWKLGECITWFTWDKGEIEKIYSLKVTDIKEEEYIDTSWGKPENKKRWHITVECIADMYQYINKGGNFEDRIIKAVPRKACVICTGVLDGIPKYSPSDKGKNDAYFLTCP